ncbi:MAG: YigZ family protein [Sphingobacteriales bacterium]|nr:MAG: YigZ family protein [Sphingobacteriales bacterium]
MAGFRFHTIDTEGRSDFRDRGSKFFGYAYPVDTPEDCKLRLQALKKEHPKASHFCLAWRMGPDGEQHRVSDDGEPSGSAGKPIEGQILSSGLTNVMVVVVRYFGGSLLGVPGLINAYKTAAAEAIAQCTIVEKNVEYLCCCS